MLLTTIVKLRGAIPVFSMTNINTAEASNLMYSTTPKRDWFNLFSIHGTGILLKYSTNDFTLSKLVVPFGAT